MEKYSLKICGFISGFVSKIKKVFYDESKTILQRFDREVD